MDSRFSPERTLRTLPLQISDQIAERILDGGLMPGERLRETELANSFEVSRATIREALRLLEQRGLVQIRPQRGAQVTQLSVKELEDLFEVRASLLSSASRLAAENLQPEDAAELRAMLSRLEADVENAAKYTATSWEAISTIAVLSRNDVLAHYIRDFAQRIGRYVRMGLQEKARRRESLENWKRLMDAIIRGDEQEAGEVHRQLALDNRKGALQFFLNEQHKSRREKVKNENE